MRREGSYIYEEFMPTGGTDVKVVSVSSGLSSLVHGQGKSLTEIK